MLHLPCYICIVSLALLLAVQQYQHNRTNRGLIDKILESKGLNPLPDEHPLAEAVTKIKNANEPLTEKRKQEMLERVRFNIPNMPILKGK